MKVGKCDELLEKSCDKLRVKNPNNLIVFQDDFAIIGISLVLIGVEMATHNFTARRVQIRNVTMSVVANGSAVKN